MPRSRPMPILPTRHLFRLRRAVPLLLAVWLGWAIVAVSSATAQERNFLRQQVPLEREMGEIMAFDLTGDGRQELLVAELDRAVRDPLPFLTVYGLTGEHYAPLPEASGPLPYDLAMLGAGHFPFGPGLVLLAPQRLEIRPWRKGRFHRQEARVLPVESIFVKPGGELKGGFDWIVDLDGDGFDEIIVPRLDGFEVVRIAPDGTPYRHVLLRVRASSRLWGYLQRRELAYRLPSMRYVELDGRGWKDIVSVTSGLVQVFPLSASARGVRGPELEYDLQPPRPFDPQQPRDPPIRLVLAEDLNRDGVFDLVFTKFAPTDNELNTNTRVLIYYGQAGAGEGRMHLSAKPDQVFVSEGFTLPILTDLNGDGRTDLALANVEIGFWTAIKALIARTVSAETAFYLMAPDGRYPQFPTDVVDYSVRFSLGRFSHHPIAAFGDLNGDGRPDLLLSADRSALGIHLGRREGFWNGAPDALLEALLPIKKDRVRVMDLDGDGRDDLIFLYNRNDIRAMPEVNHRFAVLLSRFARPAVKNLAGSP